MGITQDPQDSYLLTQISQGNQTALSLLYDRYARLVQGLAYRILNSSEDAEEVVIDVFSQIWRKAQMYDPKKSRVDTWIFMITRSRALDRLRSLTRANQAVMVSEQWMAFPVDTTEEDLIIAERREQVQQAIAQLPSEQRQVIELAYYQGLSHAEIAAQIGLPLGTIKTRIRLGLNKLRRELHP